MKLKIKACTCLCILEVFEINNIAAEYEDFGTKADIRPDIAEDYCCGCMKFTPRPATNEILQKYKIDVDEYNQICEELDKALSFGECGLCS